MDAKIKIGIDKSEVLKHYKFMIGWNFFTGYERFQNLLIYPQILPLIETMNPSDPKNLLVKKWKSLGQLEPPL